MKNLNILTFSLLACASGLLFSHPASAQDRQAYANGPDKSLMGSTQQVQSALLYEATLRGDLQAVMLAITHGADVNRADRGVGDTPLCLASSRGYLAIVQALIAAGADVNQGDYRGDTPLGLASSRGRLEVVQVLIAAGADVNQGNYRGDTPLCIASWRGKLEIAKVLIDSTHSFASCSPLKLERILDNMIICEEGDPKWTDVIELFEARTGVTRVSLDEAWR